VKAGTAGHRQAGIVLCHQVTTLDRAKTGRRVGELPAAAPAEVEQGLRVALELD
jgi:mRNA-degrading endonuclease toxin of MazEF toxin-antitoxin module